MLKSHAGLPKRRIGKTSVYVSELGFGASSLGNLYRPISDEQVIATLNAAIDSGIDYFDTAPFYGLGLSERRVGDQLRQLDSKTFTLSTKVGRLLVPSAPQKGSEVRYGFATPMPFEPHFDYSYDAVMRSYEDSTQRLGLADIDILFVHDIGKLTHGEANTRHFRDLENGGYKALDELRSSGCVKAIGLGVKEWQVCEAAMNHGHYDCFLLAGRYTLLEQNAIESFLPKCMSTGSTVIVGGAYNSGILATGTRHQATPLYDYAPAPEEMIKRTGDIEDICEKYNVNLAAAALQFPMAHPAVSSVIPGLSSPRRIAQTIDLYNEKIHPDFWSELKTNRLIREASPTPARKP